MVPAAVAEPIAPHLLLLTSCRTGEGAGTPVVLHRHLVRFRDAGWRITEVVHPPAVEAGLSGDGIEVLRLPYRRRWWPPHRESSRLSTAVRAALLADDVRRQLGGKRPDVVLTVLEPRYAAVAAAVARQLRRPLAVIIHDRPELWEDVVGDVHREAHVRREAERVLARAAVVFPVTRALGEAYGPSVAQKSVPLLPIPAGAEPAAGGWREAFRRPHLVLSGSLHPFQRPSVAALAVALEGVGGRLTLVSHHDLGPFEPVAAAHPNVSLRPAFASSAEALAFCRAEASALLVSYAFDAQPWAATSFPSKLVEFVHLGLPVLILAPPHAAVSSWARSVGWTSHVDSMDRDALTDEVAALATPAGWARRADDSHRAAVEPFDPKTIHSSLAEAFEALLPAELRRGLTADDCADLPSIA